MELTKLTEDLDKKKYWQEHVASWRVSNLSQAEYCRINGLRTYVFSYWKRKESKAEEVPLRFFPLVTADHRSIARCASALKLNIQEKRFNIEIGEDFSPIVLSRLIATLEQL
jgi:hypothetical protein